MTVISRTHKLYESIWQWAVQLGEDHWFGTVAYRDHHDQWKNVSTITFDTEEDFHRHVDNFVNGFKNSEK